MSPKKPKKEPLSITHPELAAQWHPGKNDELKPDMVTAGSGKKVWWQCPEGPDHTWEDTLNHRSRGRGCPFCAGKRPSITNSLASLHPDLTFQWHPAKNGDLTPKMVVAGSNKKVWWKCHKGPDHEWQATVSNRSNGRGCPYCRGLQPSVTNSLASLYPEIAAEWHLENNGDLTPYMVVAGER